MTFVTHRWAIPYLPGSGYFLSAWLAGYSPAQPLEDDQTNGDETCIRETRRFKDEGGIAAQEFWGQYAWRRGSHSESERFGREAGRVPPTGQPRRHPGRAAQAQTR